MQALPGGAGKSVYAHAIATRNREDDSSQPRHADVQFHGKCVNITGELPETWYCPDCVKLLGFASSAGRAGGQTKTSQKDKKKGGRKSRG